MEFIFFIIVLLYGTGILPDYIKKRKEEKEKKRLEKLHQIYYPQKLLLNSSKKEYTNFEILEKLQYYENKQDMNQKETLNKIKELKDMILCMIDKLDKLQLRITVRSICNSTEKILEKVKNKENINDITHFIYYYLPTTLKILVKYDEIENLRLKSENSNAFLESIENNIKKIDEAFKIQLETLYNADIENMQNELTFLDNMLKMDGYTDIKDFSIKK